MPVISNKNGAVGAPKAGVPAPIAAGLLVVGLVAGFAAGKLAVPSKAKNMSAPSGTYEAGYSDAKKKLEQLAIIAPEPEQLTELSGVILEVKGSSFTMRVDGTVLNPLVQDVPEVREVRVGSDTVLSLKVKRDEAAYKADLDAYDKALSTAVATGKAAPEAPSPYENKKLSLTDLKKDDHVVVKAGHDVKRDAAFDAMSVELGFGSRLFVPAPVPESRPPAPSDNRPPPPKAGQAPPLPPLPTQ